MAVDLNPLNSSKPSPLVVERITPPKWVVLASTIGVLAGALLIALTLAKGEKLFGKIGTIAAISTGSVVTAFCLSYFLWTAIANCKRHEEHKKIAATHEDLDHTVESKPLSKKHRMTEEEMISHLEETLKKKNHFLML